MTINGRSITAAPRETILKTALRSGIDFPNSCRVGACGACKCRLTEGNVKELTETGYLLTADEIEKGYILACQSVPHSNVRIDVVLAAQTARKQVRGRVVEQAKITHDITRLTIQLDEPLAYRAGQFAGLTFDGLDGAPRSYSFATPESPDARVTFLVRKVPGGRLSSLVNDEDVVGRAVSVDGPAGEFWLRPSDAPLLFVAGGSGLAPILAILRQALAEGVTRSVTLLFGARDTRDLYALEEIEALARDWRGSFRFVPVLSSADSEASWSGERGLVTETIAKLIEPASHGYLCGPPLMIDAALASLKDSGVRAEHTHFDRFTTQADIDAGTVAKRPESSPDASVFHYLKFFMFHLIGLFSVATILAGGRYVTAGLLLVLAGYILGDALSGDDTSMPTFKRPWVLSAQLWLALPLLALIMFVSVWSVCPSDPLGFGDGLSRLTGYDLVAARAATGFGHHVSAWVLGGLMIGMVGTIPGHELTHRTWDPISTFIGRWLLAFSFDTTFAIEHVYGHHRYVSTVEDPATAPRGRNVYFHVLVSTLKGNVSAWKIEAARLEKKRLGLFSRHNRWLSGHLMSVLLVVVAFVMGGLEAAMFFTACALWGKALLEIVNYMEHYGMVRAPGTSVQPRHSWNTNRRMSSWTMFNLTRHSHHHAQGEVPYQDLKPYANAPMMINGYLTTLVVAMIPPLWHALMTPKVLAWDRDFATEEERALAARANGQSGIRGFIESRPVGV